MNRERERDGDSRDTAAELPLLRCCTVQELSTDWHKECDAQQTKNMELLQVNRQLVRKERVR